jgi:broad specificity phosphatase PhoE
MSTDQSPSGPLTRVHLVRHGLVHNPEGVLYGRIPGFRLAEAGERMADRLADHFAGRGEASQERRDVAVVTASPLERAQQTAAPIGAAFGLEVGTDADLIEAENHFEGLTIGHGKGNLLRPEHWLYLRNPIRPSWGEPYRAQVDRMVRAIRAARASAEGREAVLVSHQLPIWVTRLHLERRRLAHDPRRRQCTLASVTTLTFEGTTLAGISYSEPALDLLPTGPVVPGA